MSDYNEKREIRLQQKVKEIKTMYAHYLHDIPKGHIGGGLSMCECIVALYYEVLNLESAEKDLFILSKGHCSQMMYCIAVDMGLVSYKEIVEEYNTIDGRFGSHPHRIKAPLIDFSTGALGHGLSVAVGAALFLRNKKSDSKVYCMVGDGELNEGSNWEALMSANQYELSNLCTIIDKNEYSSSDLLSNVMTVDPLKEKLISFGLNVIEVNGHDLHDILCAFDSFEKEDRKSTAIILHTKKGNGFWKIEDEPRKWHNGHIGDELLKHIINNINQ